MDRLIDVIRESKALYWSLPFIGGFLDYLNQHARKEIVFTWSGLILHLASSAFFGVMAGLLVWGLGHHIGAVGAASGVGGFIGTRLAGAVLYRIRGDRRAD